MYTYKLGGMLITDELYHDDLEAMTFGRKDQNELMHYGIKGQSWGKRRFQNEDGSLTMAGRNRYDVGDPLQGSTNRAMAANRTYATGGGTGGFGGASGGGGSVTPKGSPTIRTYGSFMTPGGKSYEIHDGPGQSAGRTVTNKVKAKVNNTVNSGRKAADNLFSSIGNWASNAAKDVGNFATNTYNDASKAVTNAANTVGNTVKNVAQDVSDWYTGDKNSKEAEKYDRVVQNYERAGDENINSGREALGYKQHDLASQYGQKANEAQARYDAAPRQLLERAGNWVGDRARDVGNAASNIWDDVSATARGVADDVGNRLTGNIDRNTAESLRRTADFQEDSNAPFHAMGEQYTPENLRRQADEYQKRADNSLFSRIGNAAKDVGDWTSNAASDVRDWGAGALDKGRQAFESLFGRSGSSDNGNIAPIETRTIEDNFKPIETRTIEDNFKPIETREIETRPTVSGSNNVQIWDNANVNGWDNVRTFGDPGMAEIARQFANQQNSQNQRRQAENAQYEQRRKELLSDKPDNVPDEYWEAYKSNGGTRDSYDRQMQARQNSQNNRPSSNSSSMSDKPSNVSDEFWREYTSNGGTKEGFDRTFKQGVKEGLYKEDEYFDSKPLTGVSLFEPMDHDAVQKQMNDTLARQNGNFASTSVVSGNNTVDTSRPYHFTYDPASGQTIVVYDDEKRR